MSTMDIDIHPKISRLPRSEFSDQARRPGTTNVFQIIQYIDHQFQPLLLVIISHCLLLGRNFNLICRSYRLPNLRLMKNGPHNLKVGQSVHTNQTADYPQKNDGNLK